MLSVERWVRVPRRSLFVKRWVNSLYFCVKMDVQCEEGDERIDSFSLRAFQFDFSPCSSFPFYFILGRLFICDISL